jgi:hypothetical protein
MSSFYFFKIFDSFEFLTILIFGILKLLKYVLVLEINFVLLKMFDCVTLEFWVLEFLFICI